jgi:hypothetical protein
MRGLTSFEAATFSSKPPGFFGAKLHEGTVWRDVNWPASPMNAAEARWFVDAYERLKLEMDRLKKHEDELDFFARELQSRRILHGDWKLFSIKIAGMTIALEPRKLFGWPFALPSFTMQVRTVVLPCPAPGLAIALYGFLCDYGRSYVRPFYGLIVTAIAGTLPFWAYFGLHKFRQAIGLSLANTFSVLGFRKDFIDSNVIESIPGTLKVVAALQSIAGIVLLFLFGLAIRNRFRMK